MKYQIFQEPFEISCLENNVILQFYFLELLLPQFLIMKKSFLEELINKEIISTHSDFLVFIKNTFEANEISLSDGSTVIELNFSTNDSYISPVYITSEFFDHWIKFDGISLIQ